MLSILPQLLFTGLGIGAIYAIASLGFVLLIRAANVVNFAQGQFSMLGAYIMLVLLVGRRRAVLGGVPAGDRADGRVRHGVRGRGLLAAAQPRPARRDHQHDRRLDPAAQRGAGDLRAEPGDRAGPVRQSRLPGRAACSWTRSISPSWSPQS